MEEVFETWDDFVRHVKAQNGKDVEFSLDSFDRVALAGHRDLLAGSGSNVRHYVIPLKDGDCIRIAEHLHYYLAKWENSLAYKHLPDFLAKDCNGLISSVGAMTSDSKLLESILSK